MLFLMTDEDFIEEWVNRRRRLRDFVYEIMRTDKLTRSSDFLFG